MIFVFNYMQKSVCGYVHVRADVLWRPDVSDPLQLELEGVVYYVMWELNLGLLQEKYKL